MKPNPPVMASWLLEHFGIPQRNEPLIGDLLEEHSSGRSALWFWRQTFVALAITAAGDIWNHKLPAVRAIATGLIAMLPLRAIRFHLASQRWGDNPIVFWALTFLSFAFAGWVVAHTHRRQKGPMALAFVTYAFIYKTWLFAAHYHQFWSRSHAHQFPIDASLTGTALLCSLVGSFLPAPPSFYAIGRAVGLGLGLAFMLPAMPLDRELVQETVTSLSQVVQREYVDAEAAARADASLRQWLAEDRYAAAQTPDALAGMLTRDLFELTRDKHLSVAVVPERASMPTTQSDESRETRARRSNFGVKRVEILAGNVGYLNITQFERLAQARDAISAAMRMLRHADALIVDLRGNGGGSPDTVASVASYFFDAPGVALFEIVLRSGEGGTKYRTETAPLPERNGRRPVYLLTSAGTFSAGEGFAFILQERRRAQVVGETTAGAANPGRPYPLNARFEVTVPNGRVRSAVSGGNWEGVGVTPDVKTTATEALRVAHARALRDLIELAPSGSWRDTLHRELKILDLGALLPSSRDLN
jgi:hypothetical protein